MRAKFVFEKFEETSDPIKDMGILDSSYAKICDEIFETLYNKVGARPYDFPWNCYFLLKNENRIGVFYKYGDRLFYVLYFATPKKLEEIDEYKYFLSEKVFGLERISKDILRKTEMFKRYNPKVNYNEQTFEPLKLK